MRKVLIILGILIVSVVLSGCGEKAGEATSALCDSLWGEYEHKCRIDRCARPSLDKECYAMYREIAIECPVECKEKTVDSLSEKDLVALKTLISEKDNEEESLVIVDITDSREKTAKAVVDSEDLAEAVVVEEVSLNTDVLEGRDAIATVNTVEQNTDMLSTCNCILSSRLVCYDGHQWNETMQMTNDDPCTCEYVQSSPQVACDLIYPQSSGYCLPDASGCDPNA